jgi:hypothetical protein
VEGACVDRVPDVVHYPVCYALKPGHQEDTKDLRGCVLDTYDGGMARQIPHNHAGG